MILGNSITTEKGFYVLDRKGKYMAIWVEKDKDPIVLGIFKEVDLKSVCAITYVCDGNYVSINDILYKFNDKDNNLKRAIGYEESV